MSIVLIIIASLLTAVLYQRSNLNSVSVPKLITYTVINSVVLLACTPIVEFIIRFIVLINN